MLDSEWPRQVNWNNSFTILEVMFNKYCCGCYWQLVSQVVYTLAFIDRSASPTLNPSSCDSLTTVITTVLLQRTLPQHLLLQPLHFQKDKIDASSRHMTAFSNTGHELGGCKNEFGRDEGGDCFCLVCKMFWIKKTKLKSRGLDSFHSWQVKYRNLISLH